MTNQQNRTTKGFTIVELVVIIAVLAILITITAISYANIQTRARVANTENNAKLLQKKVQAYFNISNKYPAPATTTTELNSFTASKLEGVVAIGTPTGTNGERTLKLELCTAGATGYRITYWDYPTGTLPGTAQLSGGANITSCSAWTNAT